MPWRRVVLRGTEVLARCDAAGKLADQGGRVEIRYRANDSKSYRAATRNLELGSEDILPDEHCSDAEPAPDKKAVAPVSAAKADLIAYTDGACSGNPGPAGIGVVILDGGKRRELSEYLGTGTNNIAELMAIVRALEEVPRERTIVLHSDSSYSLGLLGKGWKAKANQELVERMRELARGFSDLRLVKVDGHAGVAENERADELARAAVVKRG